jgi:hypothetical protein
MMMPTADSTECRPALACGYTMRSGFRPDGLRRLIDY